MGKVRSSEFPLWGRYANGVLTFVLTLLTFISVRQIRFYYTIVGRLPQLLEELSDYSTQLLFYRKDLENRTSEIRVLLEKIDALAYTISRTIQGSKTRMKQLNELITQIESSRKSQLLSTDLETIYIKVERISEELRQLGEDLKWQR